MSTFDWILLLGFVALLFGIVSIESAIKKQTAILGQINDRLARRWVEDDLPDHPMYREPNSQ